MTGDDYQKIWRDSIEKRFDRLDEAQLRQRSTICELEIRIGSVNEELHDVHKSVDAIGAKLDILRDELVKNEVVPMAKRVQQVLRGLLASFVAILVGAAVWAIKGGAAG